MNLTIIFFANQDLRNVIARCFSKIVGFWPVFNNISSISQYYTEIISQSPCNHIFITFIYNIMCEYNTFVKPLALDCNAR